MSRVERMVLKNSKLNKVPPTATHSTSSPKPNIQIKENSPTIIEIKNTMNQLTNEKVP